MRKLIIYLRYIFEYLKFWDITSVISSFKYVLNRTSHQNDRIVKTSIGTFFCRKNTNDFQYANYAYEWSIKKYIRDHHQEYNVYIDGGACIGEYSILFAGKNIRCIAFEPVKSNFDCMVKNVELNGLASKIKCFPFGLGDKNELVNFVLNTVNTGASHFAAGNKPGDCTVEIRFFDSLLPELNLHVGDRILFKLDVEGMEPMALLGAKDFIKRCKHLTFIIEAKFSGENLIKEILNGIALFEFGKVDDFNIYARKIN